jgi:hypothetical protein
MKSHLWKRVAVHLSQVVLMSCLWLVPANAQQTLGSINGTIFDVQGAVVPDSEVTVTDAEIGVTRATKSSSTGYFQVFNLPIGTYNVRALHNGFETTELTGVSVKEAQATTLNINLKVGQTTASVNVTATPMLNATDATNGYTMDDEQISLTPLATGSFTQLAVLSPGTNAELLSGLGTMAGLGNQPVWANGQRDTSNTFQVNGVDATNLFNGKSSSGMASQRTSHVGGITAAIGGIISTSTSVYASVGNSLPTPPPESLQEVRVNTSLYDAQQGATSGAQIDATINSGTNRLHGQLYGSVATNAVAAAPFFTKQQYLLGTQGVGAFPQSLANPALHRWTTGATIGGPIKRDKVYFFIAYQHLYSSDEASALSQFTVPDGLTNDRSATGLTNAVAAWNGGAVPSGFALDPSGIAQSLFNATLPNGEYLIPSAQNTAPYAYSIPNVTLVGVSIFRGDQASLALDYDLKKNDRLSFKYYYQNDPVTKPFGFSQTFGFPVSEASGATVGAVDNTISISPRLNWEQRLGYARERTYSYFKQTVSSGDGGNLNYGVGASVPGGLAAGLPGISMKEFAVKSSASSTPSLSVGPYTTAMDQGFFQNRLNPSTNVIFTLGRHTFVAGASYSYTQLNVRNNRTGHAEIGTQTFQTLLEGQANSGNVMESIDLQSGKNNSDRYYRTNEIGSYLQDKWQLLPNLSITAGVRYDYHGGMTEKYGNIFNFDANAYNVTGTPAAGFTVVNDGLVTAGNNKFDPTAGVSNSTLTGRQWGISPRVGFAWSPEFAGSKLVVSGGAGIYYDRGELFSYLSQPAGSGTGGIFQATQASPLASYVVSPVSSSHPGTLANPFATIAAPTVSPLPLGPGTNPPGPSANPQVGLVALQTQLNNMTGSAHPQYGKNCQAIDQQENSSDCTATLNIGAYAPNNKLPYTINFTLSLQWQPRNDLAVTLGYAGNRGRHGDIPFPFNEPTIASPTNPVWGETTDYGYQVLNQNSLAPSGDYNSIAVEPWNTVDGGNVDFRTPYVGYNPNAVLFENIGVSAYDALQTHVEKRLSHHFQTGVSYTWSHALDEQSDIGLFFTGDNPANLRQSYSSSDFDRTHVTSANFMVTLPNAVKQHSLLSYASNDWSLTGIGILQSGEPYALQEFYGAVGAVYLGNNAALLNPILPVKDPAHVKSHLTGNPGSFRGTGGSYIPTIDPSQIDINYLAPGTKGVPVATGTDPQDVYETDFAPGNQRNIFRQAMQKRLDLSFRKEFKVGDKIGMQFALNLYNVTNTTSLDIPQEELQIRQKSSCSTSATLAGGKCTAGSVRLNTSQIATSLADQTGPSGVGTAPGGGSAGTNLDQLPQFNGTGKSITVPTTIGVNGITCTSTNAVVSGTCPNNAANFGSVTNTIGGNRAISLSLHITY